MSDLIDRQEAIKAIRCGHLSAATIYGRSDEGMLVLAESIRAINSLPSAQPEQKCETCRYRNLEWSEEPCDSCTMGGGDCHYKPERKKGKWILDEDPHDGDCRCSVCLIAIDQMHERNHGLLNALTCGKWWRFYKFCPNCGADMRGEEDDS